MDMTTPPLRQLAADADDQHRDAMAAIRERLAESSDGDADRTSAGSRRHFLRNAGLGGLALSVGGSLVPMSRLVPAAWANTGQITESELAAFLQSVELAAVEAYGGVIDSGQLDGDQVDALEVFRDHHRDHADALGEVASQDAKTDANPGLLEALQSALADATDQESVLHFTQHLEENLAATHFYALGIFEDRDAALVSARILPVEGQHAVALGPDLDQAIDEYVPTFQSQDGAYTPAEYPVNG